MIKFARMEEEVKAGIAKFQEECTRLWPGVQLVIPVRPTGSNFLVSFTWNGFRTYGTIHEDDFADLGETNEMPQALQKLFPEIDKKLKNKTD
jgi:hypothetical protein